MYLFIYKHRVYYTTIFKGLWYVEWCGIYIINNPMVAYYLEIIENLRKGAVLVFDGVSWSQL